MLCGGGGVTTYLLDRKPEHLLHVGRQLGHQRFVAVVLTHVGEQNGVEWKRSKDGFEWQRWRLYRECIKYKNNINNNNIFTQPYRSTRSAPQRAGNILFLFLVHRRMHGRIFVHENEERHRPDDADNAEHVEDRWPAIVESVFGQQTGQRHRDDRSELSACGVCKRTLFLFSTKQPNLPQLPA